MGSRWPSKEGKLGENDALFTLQQSSSVVLEALVIIADREQDIMAGNSYIPLKQQWTNDGHNLSDRPTMQQKVNGLRAGRETGSRLMDAAEKSRCSSGTKCLMDFALHLACKIQV